MAQRKNIKKVSTRKRTTKKRITKNAISKKRTPKKRAVKRTAPKRKTTQHSSRGSAQHVRGIENEIKRLHTIFVKRGEDAIEDKADMLEDKIKKLARERKISKEQAKKLDNELDTLDD